MHLAGAGPVSSHSQAEDWMADLGSGDEGEPVAAFLGFFLRGVELLHCIVHARAGELHD